ncbi:MAG: hypothetical protein C5B58_01905 [Acidobacteria bacterium]|nr:MAG: hypothetical protein C5B58_01905 [Acidobacteriota bacterium]
MFWSGLVVIGGATNALLVAGALFSITILLTTGYGRVKSFVGVFGGIKAVFSQRTSRVIKAEVTPA